jgi:hypothetical protein
MLKKLPAIPNRKTATARVQIVEDIPMRGRIAACIRAAIIINILLPNLSTRMPEGSREIIDPRGIPNNIRPK